MWHRRSVTFYTVCYLLVYAASTFAADWAAILAPLTKAVPRLEMQAEGDDHPGICSGVVINPDAGFLVTAAHCVQGKNLALTVNGRHAEVVRQNRVLDLAVVRFTPKGETALTIAAKPPVMGNEVAVLGYAFGSKELQTQIGHVTNPFERDDQVMRVAVDVLAGDSGGAVVNGKGELIGITVAVRYYGPMHLGIVVPLASVQDFVEAYLPKPAEKK